MVAPTCSTCGCVLAGYELSKELNAFVYFCPSCRSAQERAARLKAKEEIAEAEVLREAA